MKTPAITDHAIVRYLERSLGIDLASLKREILPEHAQRIIAKFPNLDLKLDGLTLKVVNGVVVTVYGRSSVDIRRGRSLAQHQRSKRSRGRRDRIRRSSQEEKPQ